MGAARNLNESRSVLGRHKYVYSIPSLTTHHGPFLPQIRQRHRKPFKKLSGRHCLSPTFGAPTCIKLVNSPSLKPVVVACLDPAIYKPGCDVVALLFPLFCRRLHLGWKRWKLAPGEQSNETTQTPVQNTRQLPIYYRFG